MGRKPDQFCEQCGQLMSRIYVKPADGTYRPIGYTCVDGHSIFDDGRDDPFNKAWKHILKQTKRGEKKRDA